MLRECISELKTIYADMFYIGEPIYLSRIYSVLNRVDGVIDVRKVKIFNKSGGPYSNVSLDMDKILSRDGMFLKTPQNSILEIKFPNEDIKGIAK